MWISFFFLTVPMGIILGYALTIGFSSLLTAEDSYKWGFAAQTVLMLAPIALAMVFFPAHYYEKPSELHQPASAAFTSGGAEISHELLDNSKTMSTGNARKLSKIDPKDDQLKPAENSSFQSSFMRDKQALAIVDKQPLPVGKMIINLFKNPTYMLSVLCITNVMFVLIGLQFWAI
jgi:hypothetical protein